MPLREKVVTNNTLHSLHEQQFYHFGGEFVYSLIVHVDRSLVGYRKQTDGNTMYRVKIKVIVSYRTVSYIISYLCEREVHPITDLAGMLNMTSYMEKNKQKLDHKC